MIYEFIAWYDSENSFLLLEYQCFTIISIFFTIIILVKKYKIKIVCCILVANASDFWNVHSVDSLQPLHFWQHLIRLFLSILFLFFSVLEYTKSSSLPNYLPAYHLKRLASITLTIVVSIFIHSEHPGASSHNNRLQNSTFIANSLCFKYSVRFQTPALFSPKYFLQRSLNYNIDYNLLAVLC